MKLYHGTSETAAKLVLSSGLQPRAKHRGQHNWKHAFAGNRHTVYLTDAYPVTYAVEAVETMMKVTQQPERLAILEVATERLDPSKFVPDEDVLEQALRGKDALPTDWTMLRRCWYYQSHLQDYADRWPMSLELLGTCGYMGCIPRSAITRVALVDYQQAAHAVWFVLNASISLMNYRFVGMQHKTITRWFFGDPLPELSERDKLWYGDVVDHISSLPRNGIEIIS